MGVHCILSAFLVCLLRFYNAIIAFDLRARSPMVNLETERI